MKFELSIENDRLFVRSQYASATVDRYRIIPGSQYHPERRAWSFPAVRDVVLMIADVCGVLPDMLPAEVAAIVGPPQRPAIEPVDLSLIADHEFVTPAYDHQKTNLARLCAQERWGIWDEMGCVDGDAVVNINRNGVGKKISLRDLFVKFGGGKTKGQYSAWDLSSPTFIRSLCDGEFHQHRIVNVLSQGKKSVVKITLASGKSIRLTPDHEVLLEEGRWVSAENLAVGSKIMVNGTPVCSECGSTNIKPNCKRKAFEGLCRQCVYARMGKPKWKGGRFIDDDGYVRVTGKQDHPRANTTGQVYEHILVMEKIIGRPVSPEEIVHHKNENKQDNRPENLELLAGNSVHAAMHGKKGGYLNMNGGKGGRGGDVIFIPKVDEVQSVVDDGVADVYDVVCADPHRNFVANGIVVHNCGKTKVICDRLKRFVGATGDLPENFNALILCPKSVLDVWRDQLMTHGQLACNVVEGAAAQREKLLHGYRRIRVANYEALLHMGDSFERVNWDVVVLDECVVPETMILTPQGQRPIAGIKAGDEVYGYDHKTNSVVPTKVTYKFERTTSSPIIEVSGIRLTGNHPIYSRERGYVEAENFDENLDSVVSIELNNTHEKNSNRDEVRQEENRVHPELSGVRTGIHFSAANCKGKTSKVLRDVVFGEVANASAGSTFQGFLRGDESQGFGIQQEGMEGSFLEFNGRSEGLPVQRQEPVSQGGSQTTRRLHNDSGWERKTPIEATPDSSRSSGLGAGISNISRQAENEGLPDELQGRPGRSEGEVRCRDRRANSQRQEGKREGQEEVRCPGEAGVEDVSRSESRRSAQAGYGRPDDTGSENSVHNLETLTGNYFANGVLVHNCHRIKNFTAQTARRARKLTAKARYVWGLSGTPAPNGLEDWLGVLSAIDPNLLPVSTKTAFEARYCVKSQMGPGGPFVITGYRNVADLHGYIASRSSRFTKDECLDLPPKVYSVRTVHMEGEQARVYRELKRDAVARLGGFKAAGTLSVKNVLSEGLRLLQVVGGFVPDDDGNLHDLEPKCKLAALRDVLDEVGSKQVVIWCEFKAEVEWIAGWLGANYDGGVVTFTGATVGAERGPIIESFQSGDVRYFVGTAAAGGTGITLHAADTEVFYSRGFNLAQYLQAVDRLHRIGQKNTVSVVRLMAQDTVDARVHQALEDKADMQEMMLRNPEEWL